MARNEVKVTITGDASRLSTELGQAESKLGAFSEQAKNVGTSMMGTGALMTAGITAPLALFAKSSVTAFTEANKAQAQLDASLKSTGATAWTSSKEIDALAQSMQDKLAIDGDLVKSGASVLLTFTNVQNKAGEGNDVFNRATQAAADMAAKLGTDLPAANMQLGKALNDPVRGMAALRRAGVQLTSQQEEQVKQFVATGDVVSAQKVLLEELERQFGGSAEAAGKADGGIEALRLRFEDLQESIGQRLLPIIEKLGGWLVKGFEWWDKLGDKGQTIALIMAGVAAAIGPVVTVVGALVTAIGFLASPVGLVVAAIGALVAGFVYLYKTNDGFREWVNGVVTEVRDRLGVAFQWFKDNVLPALGAAFQWFADNAVPALQDAFERISSEVFPIVQAAFQWLQEEGIPGMVIAFQWFRDNVVPVLVEFGSFLAAVFDFVVAGTVAAIENFRSMAQAIAGVMNWLWPVIQVVWTYIVESISAAMTIISGIITTVTALIRGDWSAVWEGIRQIAQGVWEGIVALVSGALGVLGVIIGGALSAISGAWSSAWSWMRETASSAVNSVVSFFTGLPGRLLGVVGSVAAAAGAIGSAIARSIGSGISNVMGQVGDIATSLWRGIAGFINTKIIDRINAFSVTVPVLGRIDFPDLPRLHTGGTVPGIAGQESLYVLEAGESVRTALQEARLQNLFATAAGAATTLTERPAGAPVGAGVQLVSPTVVVQVDARGSLMTNDMPATLARLIEQHIADGGRMPRLAAAVS